MRFDRVPIVGHGFFELFDQHGVLIDRRDFGNLVTQTGEQFYLERALGVGSLTAVTGMQLGTGTTAPAKTGAGAAVGAYVTGSAVAFLATYPQSSLASGLRRGTFKSTWGPGVATNGALAEAVLILQAVGTDSGASAALTIARCLLSPTIPKGALDTLTGTWIHDLGAP